VTHTETGMVSKTTWRFGPEDMDKAKFIIKYFKRVSWTGLFQSFHKFKIASLEAELQLPKLQQKSHNHTSLNRS
jgi:hypothetical protein